MQLVVLNKALWLELDVTGRNLGNFYLHLLPRWTNGNVFQACVRSVVLYGSENWAMKEEDLERNDMMMVWWMCM